MSAPQTEPVPPVDPPSRSFRRWSARAPVTPKPSLAAFFQSERLGMVRLAVLLVDDVPSAEDVTQEAFLGLVKAWPGLDCLEAARAYLRTSVVNRSRSMLRRRRTARAYDPPSSPAQPGADDALLLAEEYRSVLGALGTLPERQREVLVLRYWSDLPEAEIARTLGISRGTVKSSASRGLAGLRTALDRAPGGRGRDAVVPGRDHQTEGSR